MKTASEIISGDNLQSCKCSCGSGSVGSGTFYLIRIRDRARPFCKICTVYDYFKLNWPASSLITFRVNISLKTSLKILQQFCCCHLWLIICLLRVGADPDEQWGSRPWINQIEWTKLHKGMNSLTASVDLSLHVVSLPLQLPLLLPPLLHLSLQAHYLAQAPEHDRNTSSF